MSLGEEAALILKSLLVALLLPLPVLVLSAATAESSKPLWASIPSLCFSGSLSVRGEASYQPSPPAVFLNAAVCGGVGVVVAVVSEKARVLERHGSVCVNMT